MSVVTGRAEGYRLTVLQNFFNEFFKSLSQGVYVKFPAFVWLIICLSAVLLAAVLGKRENKQSILCGGFSGIAVFALFSISLLYSYLFVFEEIEATGLASFYRYLNTGILPMIMVSFVMLLWVCSELKKPLWQAAACLACACLLFNAPGVYGFWDILKEPAVSAAQTHHDRYLYIRTARYIRQLGGTSRVYLITAYDGGWTQMLVNYELQPEIVLPEQYTMLSATPRDDPSVYIMSAEEWSRLLYEDYDYVYIHCPETQFVADYLSVFEDESQVVVDRMFEVIRQPDGTAKLRRIEMIPEDGYV